MGDAASLLLRKKASEISVKSECEVRFSLPCRPSSCLLMEKKQGEQMVSEFILYLALIQLGAVTAVTAAVVGVLLLVYRSVPNRNSEICSAVNK